MKVTDDLANYIDSTFQRLKEAFIIKVDGVGEAPDLGIPLWFLPFVQP